MHYSINFVYGELNCKKNKIKNEIRKLISKSYFIEFIHTKTISIMSCFFVYFHIHFRIIILELYIFPNWPQNQLPHVAIVGSFVARIDFAQSDNIQHAVQLATKMHLDNHLMESFRGIEFLKIFKKNIKLSIKNGTARFLYLQCEAILLCRMC